MIADLIVAAMAVGCWSAAVAITITVGIRHARAIRARRRTPAPEPTRVAIPITRPAIPGVPAELPELTAEQITELHDACRAITRESTGGIR